MAILSYRSLGILNYGLLFGQDRIVPIYLATLAMRQQSQTIRFRTASEMLETFGMHKSGKEYRRLVAAFERIFGATIFFGTDTLRGTARMVQRSRFSFFREAQIWYSRDPDQYPVSDEFENVIVLSDEFYREIMAHPIPADLEALKVLAAAPARTGSIHVALVSPLRGKGARKDSALWNMRSGQPDWIDRIRAARPLSRKARRLAGLIRVLWPDCAAKISSDGASLEVNRAAAVLVEQKACRVNGGLTSDAIRQ